MKKIVLLLIVMGLMIVPVTLQATIGVSNPLEPTGDTTYIKRLTIVENKGGTFRDDYTYLAAIPTSIYYQDNNRYVSALVFDEDSENEKYLIEDIAKTWRSSTEIVKIGNVNNIVIEEFKRYSTPSEIKEIISDDDTVYGWAAEIAKFYWDKIDLVVIVPVFEEKIREGNKEYIKYIEVASNGAVIASLKNCPLLYVNEEIPQTTKECLVELGVQNAILITPDGFDSYSIKQQLTGMNIDVARELVNIEEIIQFVRSNQDTNYLILIYNNEEDRKEPYMKKARTNRLTEIIPWQNMLKVIH